MGDQDDAGQPRAPEAGARPQRLRTGTVLEAAVSAVRADGVLLDVGGKADGVLPLAEAVLAPDETLAEAFPIGRRVEVAVVGFDVEAGAPRLSQRRAVAASTWRELAQACQERRPVEAPVREVVKGGLVCDLGVRGFMPASQVERGPVADLAAYVGQSLRARILECDPAHNSLILSRRAVLEEERLLRRTELWAELAEGQIRAGVVKALADFGAFIDLGGVDGLLHISAMSWERVARPSDLLAVGQTVQVKILRLDREHDKVSLGLKQASGDPWTGAAERYPVGATVRGRVIRLCPFGAFVQLQPGVDGLIHISQLSEDRVRDPADVVAEGQDVRVKVLRLSEPERRISLSLREAEPDQAPQPNAAGRQDAVTVGEVLGSAPRAPSS